VKQLTLEEFAWRCEWLECGRLDQYTTAFYTLKKVRELTRRAKKNELWRGPFFEKSEWATGTGPVDGMIRNQYAHYLKTGVL